MGDEALSYEEIVRILNREFKNADDKKKIYISENGSEDTETLLCYDIEKATYVKLLHIFKEAINEKEGV